MKLLLQIYKWTFLGVFFWMLGFSFRCRTSLLRDTLCLMCPKNISARGSSSSVCLWSKSRASWAFSKAHCWLIPSADWSLFFSLSLPRTPPIPTIRFEIEIEPIFASLALYDVKEKKKVWRRPFLWCCSWGRTLLLFWNALKVCEFITSSADPLLQV